MSKIQSHEHVNVESSRGGKILVIVDEGGGMSGLVMGGANGPSRAFRRDSGRGGAVIM